MSWWGLYIAPDIEAAYGGQFYLGMTGEFELVKSGANVEVPPEGSHILSAPIHFICEEGILCHGVMSVKDGGI